MLVVAAPIMLLIGVPAVGYLVGAGAWIVLRAVGVVIERVVPSLHDPRGEVTLRLAYLLGRLFTLAIAVILVRDGAGRDDGLTALRRDRVRIHRATGALVHDPPEVTMSKTQRILLIGFGAYIGIFLLLIAIYGFSQHKNNEFQIQNEFKLINWVSLGVFSINRAVLYLFIATLLTIFTMVWISRRMQARPNKVQTAVEVLFSLMRNNITRGNMPDSMAAKWFPFIGTLFLFIWFCNLIGYLPLPTNTRGKVQPVRRPHPVVRALCRDREHLGAAGAGTRCVHRLHLGGNQAARPGRIPEEPDSGGRPRGDADLDFPDRGDLHPDAAAVADHPAVGEHLRRAHHLLFLAGGLAVILGLQALGWFALPAGILIYLFELGLVATLQAFIFATLAAIYIAGAATHH